MTDEVLAAKFPKAVAKITADLDERLTFYDYPSEHWSTCGPRTGSFDLRHRAAPDKITRGRGSQAAGWRWRTS